MTLQGETATDAEARIRLLVAKHSAGLSVTEMDEALRAIAHLLSGWRILVPKPPNHADKGA